MTLKTTTWYLLAIAVLVALITTPTFAQNATPPQGAGEAPVISRIVPVLYPQSFPGQFWTDLGNISPVEHNDIISASYFEQGVSLYRSSSISITPYVGVGITADTLGYDWNNRVQGVAGARFNKFFKHGVVSIGGAYSYEDRWVGREHAAGPTGQIDYWFGWEPVATQTSRFPGSTWGAAGYLTPVESGNFIYAQYFKQGVVAKRFGKNDTITPFGEVTTNVDTKHFDWENRVLPGAGIEWNHTHGNTMSELGAEYLYEHRFESGLSAGGATIFFKFWFGWNPIRGGKH